jgi:preprotein translocase subunit SecB
MTLLTLHSYHFPVVQVIANPKKPKKSDINNIDYKISVGLSEEKQEKVYQVSVEIISIPEPESEEHKKSKNAYDIHLVVWGNFSVSPKWAEPEKLVRINGASILYSAAREFLITITSRGPWGAITLPTISFNQKKKDADKQMD